MAGSFFVNLIAYEEVIEQMFVESLNQWQV